jgi:hypothetical protein
MRMTTLPHQNVFHPARRQGLYAYGPTAKSVQAKWNALRITAPFLFLLGSVWMLYVFGSFKPILAALLVFFPSWGLVFLLTSERPTIRWGYVWLLSFYWFCAGIAALWDSSQGTPFTTFIDADFFYRFLMFEHIGNDLEEIRHRSHMIQINY